MNNNLWTAFENRSLPRAWFQNKNWVWICTFCTSHIFQLAWHGSSAQICRRSEESDGGMNGMNGMSCCYMTPHQFRFALFCIVWFMMSQLHHNHHIHWNPCHVPGEGKTSQRLAEGPTAFEGWPILDHFRIFSLKGWGQRDKGMHSKLFRRWV